MWPWWERLKLMWVYVVSMEQKTTAERLEETDTEKALFENDGIDLAALHVPDENDNAICGATVHTTSPKNVTADKSNDVWCDDCRKMEN